MWKRCRALSWNGLNYFRFKWECELRFIDAKRKKLFEFVVRHLPIQCTMKISLNNITNKSTISIRGMNISGEPNCSTFHFVIRNHKCSQCISRFFLGPTAENRHLILNSGEIVVVSIFKMLKWNYFVWWDIYIVCIIALSPFPSLFFFSSSVRVLCIFGWHG